MKYSISRSSSDLRKEMGLARGRIIERVPVLWSKITIIRDNLRGRKRTFFAFQVFQIQFEALCVWLELNDAEICY